MIRKIRRLVYKLGVRPKRGSVLYSPSLGMLFTLQKVMKRLYKKK